MQSQADRLLPFIGKSDFAQGVLAQIERDGYVVLPGVFSHAEVVVEVDRMWSWVETVSRGVRRRDPRSWQRKGGYDPWPCSQRDMMQLHQAGWVFSDLRELMAERVFQKLYGMQELHSSKDGFTLQRPTQRELGRPPNDHFDQGTELMGLQCIQGSVALTDQEHEDGCFLCWPGSHKHHAALMSGKSSKNGRKNWHILNDSEKAFLEEQGIRPLRVPVKKGDVILWRSDLAHKGAPPIGQRDNFRAVVYICMLPAELTPEQVYAEKQRGYEQLQTSSHWPCMEEWFSVRKEPEFDLRPYFKAPPALTARQRLLYGLDRYGSPQLSASCQSAMVLTSAAAVAHDSKSTASGGEREGVACRPRRWKKRLDASCQDRAAAPPFLSKQQQVSTAHRQQPGSQDSPPANDEQLLAIAQISSEAKEASSKQLEWQQQDGHNYRLNLCGQ